MFDKKEYMKMHNQLPEVKKKKKICEWKRRGLIGDYEDIYQVWLNCNKCKNCNCNFTLSNYKCMDHSHTTGLFRNILCRDCNVGTDLPLQTNNKLKQKNISLIKGKYVYRKTTKGNLDRKSFDTLEEAIKYRDYK